MAGAGVGSIEQKEFKSMQLYWSGGYLQRSSMNTRMSDTQRSQPS